MKEYDKVKQIFKRADQGIDYGDDRDKMSEDEILKDAIELFQDCASEVKKLLLPTDYYLGVYDNQIDLEVETVIDIGGIVEEDVTFNVLIENVETGLGVEKAELDYNGEDDEEELTYYNICLRSYISTDLPRYINLLIENIKNDKFKVERKWSEGLPVEKEEREQVGNTVIYGLEKTLHNLKHYAKVF